MGCLKGSDCSIMRACLSERNVASRNESWVSTKGKGVKMGYYIGIDLGGTNIAGGVVTETGKILSKGSIPTGHGRSAKQIADDMAELAFQVAEKAGIAWEEVCSVGMGVPGTANKETGIVEFANNLGFYDEPIVKLMEERLCGKTILFDNDANAAAWGEYVAGSGKGTKNMIAVTLGTGVGGGIILNGELYEGINYAAGELGHFVIALDGKECNCGRRGCYEAYASATALIEQTKDAMKNHPDSALWKLVEGDLERTEGKTVFDALQLGDETAKQVFDQYISYVGVGLVDLINIFQPELICIGGGISKAGEILLKPLREKIEQESYTRTAKHQTRLTIASLDNDAGIIGAALLPR